MSQRSLHLLLPIVPSKFCTPMPGLAAPAFFEKWNGLTGGEAQVVVQLKEKPQNMSLFADLSAKGLKLAVLPGVDPCPTNLVAIGCVALKGKGLAECPALALRIEINVQVRARLRPSPRAEPQSRPFAHGCTGRGACPPSAMACARGARSSEAPSPRARAERLRLLSPAR